MKKLRIGYQPFSADLTHPGDRRRLVFWAKQKGHQIITDSNEVVDVMVISERGNLGLIRENGPPIVFDLIDGYLAKENPGIDWLRGTSKVLTKKISGKPKPFSKIVANLCLSSSAVICSSEEQKITIKPYSNNIHVILDCHDEIPLLPFNTSMSSQKRKVLWEGLPATMGGLKSIQPALLATWKENNYEIDFLSDLEYFRVLGKYLPSETELVLEKFLGDIYPYSHLIPWNISNLVNSAKQSAAAIIPVDLSSSLQFLKPENRLLIMWRLGLPCLTSALPSYVRVNEIVGVDGVCRTNDEWHSKLGSLLTEEYLAEEMVIRGQSYLKEFHNSEVLLEKWDRAFESIL